MPATRITCPACQTVYEVPYSAIPPGGRDVQCAACGNNWFQLWTRAAPVAEAGLAAPVLPEDRDGDGATVTPPADHIDPVPTFRHRVQQTQSFGAFGAGFFEAPTPPLGRMTDLPAPFGRGQVLSGMAALPGGDANAVDPIETRSGVSTSAPVSPLPVYSGPLATASDQPVPQTQSAPWTTRPAASSEELDLYEDEPELDLPMPPKRQIDPEVLAVLRSEAEVETEARKRDAAQPLETQGELPLAPRPKRSASEVRERLARLQAAERRGDGTAWAVNIEGREAATEPDLDAPAARPGFPPLPPMVRPRPTTAPRGKADPVANGGLGQGVTPSATGRAVAVARGSRELAIQQEQMARRGFRIGFALPVLAASASVALYLGAPALIERVPNAAPVLTAVVERGDQVQTRLASTILSAFEKLGANTGS